MGPARRIRRSPPSYGMMTDLSAGAGSFLSALRTLPVWLLSGLAIAGYAVLFVPAFGDVDPQEFRTQWGIVVWIWAITFSILAVARALDSSVISYRAHRRNVESRRVLRFVARHQQCWWHLAKQMDESFVSQISLDIEVANLSAHPVRIVKVRLIRPKSKGDVLNANVSLPKAGSPYHSHKHPVPPRESITATLHLMVRGALAPQSRPIHATFGITDQFGEEYRLKGIVIRTNDPTLPKQLWTQRLSSWLRRLPDHSPTDEPSTADSLSQEWQHQGKFENVDLILNEERRAYAACGRVHGGLGSLNVGLQSEPTLGSAEVGSVPSLLWDKAQAKPVESPNASRLITLHDELDCSDKDDLERYLLSHLHKSSSYSDVAYFIFLALHRMGRTVDALQAARGCLSGDKVYGYSNLLGTLSAIVSHEHFGIELDCLSAIQKVLADDTEHDFRLSEKINLARLLHLDL